MAVGFSPKLPLRYSPVDGFYKLNKSLGDVAKQNIKMVILTAPGERMMHPTFGVGARNYLFDTRIEAYQELNQKIREQVNKYVPYVRILKVDISPGDSRMVDDTENFISISVTYSLPNSTLSDSLEINLFRN
tara:strand:- start:688 stop:1083 length:396 start_codon:yes stop_codon:yes gene_type:complete